jgi:hypothetical protein
MLYMSDIFAIRNVDEKTKEFITHYAEEHDLSMGEALRELMLLVQEHLAEKPTKKYKSIFDTYDKIAFKSGEDDISKNVDKILYEENQ